MCTRTAVRTLNSSEVTYLRSVASSFIASKQRQMVSSVVRAANKATAAHLSTSVAKTLEKYRDNNYQTNLVHFSFTIFHAKDVPDREAIFELFENNMRDLYTQSSFGWNPPEKCAELFHKLTRFILVRSKESSELYGFCAFRFEDEYDEDILYCYDLQISAKCRRQKLGKLLMDCLMSLAADWQMEKIVLTVFKENVNGQMFYKAYGFVTDPGCPSYTEGDEEPDLSVDYNILSLVV